MAKLLIMCTPQTLGRTWMAVRITGVIVVIHSFHTPAATDWMLPCGAPMERHHGSGKINPVKMAHMRLRCFVMKNRRSLGFRAPSVACAVHFWRC